jgi:hypothetical protein
LDVAVRKGDDPDKGILIDIEECWFRAIEPENKEREYFIRITWLAAPPEESGADTPQARFRGKGQYNTHWYRLSNSFGCFNHARNLLTIIDNDAGIETVKGIQFRIYWTSDDQSPSTWGKVKRYGTRNKKVR